MFLHIIGIFFHHIQSYKSNKFGGWEDFYKFVDYCWDHVADERLVALQEVSIPPAADVTWIKKVCESHDLFCLLSELI